jgi:hypothetical protein
MVEPPGVEYRLSESNPNQSEPKMAKEAVDLASGGIGAEPNETNLGGKECNFITAVTLVDKALAAMDIGRLDLSREHLLALRATLAPKP